MFWYRYDCSFKERYPIYVQFVRKGFGRAQPNYSLVEMVVIRPFLYWLGYPLFNPFKLGHFERIFARQAIDFLILSISPFTYNVD